MTNKKTISLVLVELNEQLYWNATRTLGWEYSAKVFNFEIIPMKITLSAWKDKMFISYYQKV